MKFKNLNISCNCSAKPCINTELGVESTEFEAQSVQTRSTVQKQNPGDKIWEALFVLSRIMRIMAQETVEIQVKDVCPDELTSSGQNACCHCIFCGNKKENVAEK